MRKYVILVFAFLWFTSLFAQYNPAFKYAWGEEFNDEGLPDEKTWRYEVGHIRNNEAQYYTNREKKNVRVEDGCLVIEAHKESKDTMRYSSASINTSGKIEFFRGRIEVRAKIPTGIGTWPAIWMLGTNIEQQGWPECGEIDIMENVGFTPHTLYVNVHTPGSRKDPKQKINGSSVSLENAFADFHVYALEWYEDRLEFFIDGKRMFTYGKDEAKPEFWRFDHPHYLLLNLAIGGAWGGQKGIDDSIFPIKYYIDWVRYFK